MPVRLLKNGLRLSELRVLFALETGLRASWGSFAYSMLAELVIPKHQPSATIQVQLHGKLSVSVIKLGFQTGAIERQAESHYRHY